MPASLRPVAALSAALMLGGVPMAACAGGSVALNQPQFESPVSLQVSVPGVTAAGALPLGYTADGRNTSPPLSWTDGPASAKSFVVLVQDPDAPGSEPAVHWLVWNIPAAVTGLPKAMRNVESPTTPLGAVQGANFHGSVGYSGPHPPQGDPPHRYHFQVFALDRVLRVRPGADARAVLSAMAGHVVASGEQVASFAAPPPKAPKTAASSAKPG